MTGQFTDYGKKTLLITQETTDTAGPISSLEFPDGRKPYVSGSGRSTKRAFGPGRALASRGPKQVSKKVTRTTATSGPCGSTLSTNAAPPLCSGNKYLERLNTAGLTLSVGIWKERVTPSGRRYWEHTQPGRRTSGRGCGLSGIDQTGKQIDQPVDPTENQLVMNLNWPTTRREDGESAGNHPGASDSLTGVTRNWPIIQTHDASGKRGNTLADHHHRDHDLSNMVDNWSTPNTPSGGPNRKSTPTHTGGLDLDGQVLNWATPDCNRSTYSGSTFQPNIREQAMIWKTPTADDSANREHARNNRGEPKLSYQAQSMFPTPAASEIRQGYQRRPEGMKSKQNQKSLTTVVLELSVLSPQDPPIPGGRQSSPHTLISPRLSQSPPNLTVPNPPAPLRLNPMFVEWMLGYRPSWTER